MTSATTDLTSLSRDSTTTAAGSASPLPLDGVSLKWQRPRFLRHQREVKSVTTTDPVASLRLHLVPGGVNPISVLDASSSDDPSVGTLRRKRKCTITTRLDLDDDDNSGVLDELLAINEEVERGGLDDGGGAAEAVRRAQSILLALDNDNARHTVEDHAELLLLGYTPWCERSTQLMPRFAEAAATLHAMGSAVDFVKLDGKRYPKAASAVGVRGFPTVLLFVNGTEHAYQGLHTKDALVTWVRKKTGVPVISLQSKHSAEEFLKKDQTFVIGVFKNLEGPEHEEFVKAATTDNEVQFVETSDASVAKVLFPGITSKEKFVGLVKSEQEKFEKFVTHSVGFCRRRI